MNKLNQKIINGYIEGYYGRLLSWDNRIRVLQKLSDNNMSHYLYAPKEDVLHRYKWRLDYSLSWEKKFKKFCVTAKSKNVQIMFGISPGLDFNFNKLDNMNHDLHILYKKCKKFLTLGVSSIVLLFDDIPDNFNYKYKIQIPEGKAHSILANKLSRLLNINIFVIPRIYADELITKQSNYLEQFGKHLYKNLIIFYCGKNIVEKKIDENSKKIVSKYVSNKVIFWDNFYANDYCPRRLFIGPWTNRSKKQSIMINPTGLIETDLLIIDIVGHSAINNNYDNWKEVLEKHNVPNHFLEIAKYFKSPTFEGDNNIKKIDCKKNDIISFDKILWKWKSELSREWYPFFFGAKQDLELYLGSLTNERIYKTQTKPFVNRLIEEEKNNEKN